MNVSTQTTFRACACTLALLSVTTIALAPLGAGAMQKRNTAGTIAVPTYLVNGQPGDPPAALQKSNTAARSETPQQPNAHFRNAFARPQDELDRIEDNIHLLKDSGFSERAIRLLFEHPFEDPVQVKSVSRAIQELQAVATPDDDGKGEQKPAERIDADRSRAILDDLLKLRQLRQPPASSPANRAARVSAEIGSHHNSLFAAEQLGGDLLGPSDRAIAGPRLPNSESSVAESNTESEYLGARRAALQRVTKLRDQLTSEGDSARLETLLRRALNDYFTADMRYRERELQKIKARVAETEARLKKRRSSREEAVELQLKLFHAEAKQRQASDPQPNGR